MSRPLELTGRQFWFLSVVRRAASNRNQRTVLSYQGQPVSLGGELNEPTKDTCVRGSGPRTTREGPMALIYEGDAVVSVADGVNQSLRYEDIADIARRRGAEIKSPYDLAVCVGIALPQEYWQRWDGAECPALAGWLARVYRALCS